MTETPEADPFAKLLGTPEEIRARAERARHAKLDDREEIARRIAAEGIDIPDGHPIDTLTAERDEWKRRAERAEAATERVWALATAAKERADRSFSRQLDGAPFPAFVAASDILATLDQPKEQACERDAELTRAEKAEATIARVRKAAEDMREWCSPYGVAAQYADHILDALNEPEGGDR